MSFGPPPSPFTQSTRTAQQRKLRRIRLWCAFTGFLAVLLGIGGWIMWPAGNSDSPANVRSAVLSPNAIRETVEKTPRSPEGQTGARWYEDGYKKYETHKAPGTWATAKIVARGIGTGTVTGVDARTGDKAWTFKLKGHLCATTQHVTNAGETAVVAQSEPAHMEDGAPALDGCDQVIFFDVDTGKKLWQVKLPRAQSASVFNTNVTMTRGTVAVAWGDGSAAFAMDHGQRLWASTGASACRDIGFAGGRALLALVNCEENGDATYRVQKIDPQTGKPKWNYRVSRGVKSVYLPSSEPPVLAVAAGDDKVTDLITLDDQGRHRATISMQDYYDPMCSRQEYGVIERCDALVVGREQLFVASKDTIEVDQASNWIISFDLATGKTGRKFEGRAASPIYPLRMSGDKLLAYRESSIDVGLSAVISIDPTTAEQTPYLLFGLDTQTGPEVQDPSMADIVVEHGRVFLAPKEIEGDATDEDNLALVVLGMEPAK
ncbi:outer membrane protein assembly factor BamB family protein [Streptomyces sp. NBC_00588]|uniref:outer membrane protein assembly factor BamB family protein n=1 Tax=Streptomyces sp. NBC_00588 TaxID=2975784 RepID=UPI002E822CA4|nr:PQQ-binding-like beta-propeller repeat protein [Streptomyces sp. NBC_00588]WUB41132.1 PQQ-binding-like beta-propeller repeat protein [Streptomyces sp. NBC_00588]